MRYLKMGGLLAVAAAAMMAFTSIASATVVRVGGAISTPTIKATNQGNLTLHAAPAEITCTGSEVEGKVGSHGFAVTAEGNLSKLTFTGCNRHLKVVRNGKLIAHTDGTSTHNGILTSSEAEITLTWTDIFFGIDVHCTYVTDNTKIGTLTGTTSSTSHAVMHIDGLIPLNLATSDSLCGEDPAQWTGTYKITTPTGLSVD